MENDGLEGDAVVTFDLKYVFYSVASFLGGFILILLYLSFLFFCDKLCKMNVFVNIIRNCLVSIVLKMVFLLLVLALVFDNG